jgi:hypothetical protein
VTKQQLHCSQVAGLFVNLCRLRSAKSACRTPSYRARQGPPIDGRCGRIVASTSVSFPTSGLGTNIGPCERRKRQATRRQQRGSGR